MKWIVDEFKRAWAQLQHWQTWLVLGLLVLFAGLAYLVAVYAFRTDSLLSVIRRTTGTCREMTNGLIIAMFSGMIFFAFTSLLTLGEVQRHFESRRRHAHADARHALLWASLWGCIAIGIAVCALVFFKLYCY